MNPYEPTEPTPINNFIIASEKSIIPDNDYSKYIIINGYSILKHNVWKGCYAIQNIENNNFRILKYIGSSLDSDLEKYITYFDKYIKNKKSDSSEMY